VEAIEMTSYLPQRAPFLFVGEFVEQTQGVLRTRLKLTGEEAFFQGHFPGMPIMPGVLMLESCFQAAAALIGLEKRSSMENSVGVVTKVENARFKGLVRPGDELEIEVQRTDEIMNAVYFKGRVTCMGKIVCAVNFQVASISQTQVLANKKDHHESTY